MSFEQSETDRRLANVVQIGVVTEVNAATATARVRIGDLDTPLIPVSQLSAGAVQVWWMPSVGEQVIIAAPSGDIAQAAVLGSIYAGNAPSSDGAVPQINLAGGKMIINGDLHVTGDVIASGVSLVHHTHSGVTPGIANTGEPNT